MPSSAAIPYSAGALVVANISAPNPVLRSLAEGCLRHGACFI